MCVCVRVGVCVLGVILRHQPEKFLKDPSNHIVQKQKRLWLFLKVCKMPKGVCKAPKLANYKHAFWK